MNERRSKMYDDTPEDDYVSEKCRMRDRMESDDEFISDEDGNVDAIAELLYDIVSRMGFKDADIEWEEWPDHVRYFVEGEDLGALIGRHGSTLEALQYIVGVINSHQRLVDHMIIVDIEGYRERREVNLRRLALRSAELAIQEGREVELDPMPSSDRRTIHMTLKSNPDVDTESEGDEPDRRVIIIPRV